MPLVWKIYADLLTGDGVPDDDLSAYWMGIDVTQGKRNADQLVADVGRCVVTLRSYDKRFSPRYSAGPYYGNLVSGRNVLIKVICDGGSELTQFRGVVDRNGWQPRDGIITGPFTCDLVIVDLMQQLQDEKIKLPLMEDIQPDVAAQLIVNEAFRSAAATGYLEFIGPMNAADTVSIYAWSGWGPDWEPGTTLGIQTYTLVSSLTGAADEVLIATDSDGSDLTPEYVAAAINADEGAGTTYGTGTDPNRGFSAVARARVGVDADDADGWVALRDTASGYDKLSTSFVVETDTMSTNVIWVYVQKQGSPTGTATLKFIYNERALPNDEQYTEIEGTFSEAVVEAGGGWVRVELDDWIVFRRHQRYHVEMSTDRTAHATNYIEWGEVSGTDNKSAENTSGTWSSLGTALAWCIPGRVDVTARWRGSLFNGLKFDSSNTDDTYTTGRTPVSTPNILGGTDLPDSLTDFDTDTDVVQWLGDAFGTVTAKQALLDMCGGSRGWLWCAEDGTLTYRPRAWFPEQIITAPSIVLDNEQNTTQPPAVHRPLVNRAVVTFSERREVEGAVIARAEGSVEIPPCVRWEPIEFVNESGYDISEMTRGMRRSTTQGPEATTFTMPFVDDGTGTIVGAKNLIQPMPGTDFKLYTEPNAEGIDATFLAQERGAGVKMPIAVTGEGVEWTPHSAVGRATLYLEQAQQRGTVLKRLNPREMVYEDPDSINEHRLKEKRFDLPTLTAYGPELAWSLARWVVERQKNELEYADMIGFRGQTTVNGVKLYEIQMGDVVQVSEDQMAIDEQVSIVIGRQIKDSKDKNEPQLTWMLCPLDDQAYWILEDATYGELPARLTI